MQHFIDLILQGKRSGCSYSENGSRKLAKLILKYVPSMDDEAINGLKNFVDFAKNHPTSAQDLLRK